MGWYPCTCCDCVLFTATWTAYDYDHFPSILFDENATEDEWGLLLEISSAGGVPFTGQALRLELGEDAVIDLVLGPCGTLAASNAHFSGGPIQTDMGDVATISILAGVRKMPDDSLWVTVFVWDTVLGVGHIYYERPYASFAMESANLNKRARITVTDWPTMTADIFIALSNYQNPTSHEGFCYRLPVDAGCIAHQITATAGGIVDVSPDGTCLGHNPSEGNATYTCTRGSGPASSYELTPGSGLAGATTLWSGTNEATSAGCGITEVNVYVIWDDASGNTEIYGNVFSGGGGIAYFHDQVAGRITCDDLAGRSLSFSSYSNGTYDDMSAVTLTIESVDAETFCEGYEDADGEFYLDASGEMYTTPI